MSDRLPWFPFETVAWRGELKLRTCSLAARAVWLEMLTVMHEATPRGYLVLNGQPVDAEALASLMSAKPREVARAMEELDEKGVYSRTAEGVIYSRKMVRDIKRRESDRSRQQKKRDKDRDVTPVVTRDESRDVTSHVTDTGARGIARQSFRDPDQNHKSTAPDGAACAQPVENAEPSHKHLCALVERELDANTGLALKGDGEVIEHMKGVAARAHLPYDGRSLNKALDAVMAKAAKVRRFA
jgi:hypothetical protein